MKQLKRPNTRHNKALHPTAYRFGFAALVPRSASPALPAAGELGRCAAALAWMREGRSTLAAGSWLLSARFGGVGVFVAVSWLLWRGVWVVGGEST